MFNRISKIFLLFFFLSVSNVTNAFNKINITGNERISDQTIIIFSEIPENNIVNETILNKILKNLYNTGFFKDVNVSINENNLVIVVKENPIIETIFLEGIKANKIKVPLLDGLILKERSSFTSNNAKADEEFILSSLKEMGYFFSKIESSLETLGNNKVNLRFIVDLGEKSKIKKISFIGNKIYKNRKLMQLIVSEEHKPWKFLSSKKFLNINQINFDERLLSNYYKNNGFYNVKIETSYANYLGDNNFELIYNINSGPEYFFNDLKLSLPEDFDEDNFADLQNVLNKNKKKKYSINTITKILNEIDKITLKKQYEFMTSTVSESINDNLINLNFSIKETEKNYIERINIYGNTITRESVIRDNLVVDEGDAFNELLHAQSINNLKGLNFFKSVNEKIENGSDNRLKVINIFVEEKATGEISAGAGVGTNGGTLGFQISENNFLGKGIKFTNNIEIASDSLKGILAIQNPNFRGTNKSVYASLESSETDKLVDYGYKTKKIGFDLGGNAEYFEDFFIKTGISAYYENLKTASNASSNIIKQKGNFFDTYFNYTFDYDKRNQKFKTSEGFRSKFIQSVPIISKKKSLINTYDFKVYNNFLDKNLLTLGFYASASNSLIGKNVKLSERRFLPSDKLRGFERGKVGPMDGTDYIGGNYAMSFNIATTLPQILPNSQNTDFSLFIDAANIWGIDYNSSINDSSTIRSSAGIAVDWFTPIGPLNFSLSEVLNKHSNDKTESFRFNLGTTF